MGKDGKRHANDTLSRTSSCCRLLSQVTLLLFMNEVGNCRTVVECVNVIAVYKGSRKSSNFYCSLDRIWSFRVDFASVGNCLEVIGLTRTVGGLRLRVGRMLLVLSLIHI